MGKEVVGTIIEKAYYPPPGAPDKYWCYIMVETGSVVGPSLGGSVVGPSQYFEITEKESCFGAKNKA